MAKNGKPKEDLTAGQVAAVKEIGVVQPDEPDKQDKPTTPAEMLARFEELPTFDFRRVNRKWQMAYVRAETMFARQSERATALAQDMEATDEAVGEAFDVFEERAQAKRALMVQVIEAVPRDWLTADAPKEIDWDVPASMDYIRADRESVVELALREALANPAGK